MSKTGNRIWLIVAALLAITLIGVTLEPMALHPWNVVPELDGDGGKNIFTYLFHAIYERGIWFRGMNYPYGEHMVFTDGQPLLSVPLSYIGHISAGQALAVMGWLIVLTNILGIVYVYLILRHFSVRPLLSVVFAGLIGLFAPQMFRVMGHYSMAYACFVPMLFLWSARYHETGRIRYPIYIFVLGSMFTFLHPYFSAHIFLWVFFYSAGYVLLVKKRPADKIRHLGPLWISVVALFLLITLVMKLTDPATDRPQIPFGALSACTDFRDLLTSQYSPYWNALSGPGKLMQVHQEGEGFCYPGLVVIALFLISMIRGAYLLITNNKTGLIFHGGKYSPVWLFIGIFTFLFSMGIPFIWRLQWLLEAVSFFHQFRALGRFSWLFFYILSIYSVLVIDRWHTTLLLHKKRIAAVALVMVCVAAWGAEASGNIFILRKRLHSAADNIVVISPDGDKNLPANLRALHYDPTSFQAIIILKFFEIGSEKLWIGDDYVTVTGVYTALQMKLPLVDAMMSRTPWSVAEKQVKLLAGPYVRKPILEDISSHKPFLVLQREQDTLNADIRYLLTAADYIGHVQNCFAYALYPDRLRDSDLKNQLHIQTFSDSMLPGTDTCICGSGSWYVNHFDRERSPFTFFGTGSLAYRNQLQSEIALVPVVPADSARNYEFSCWFLLGSGNYKSPAVQLTFLDEKGKNAGTHLILTGASTDNFGLWFRAEDYFALPARCRAIRCAVIDRGAATYKAIDELMIRPEDAVLISKAPDGGVLVNNHRLEQTAKTRK